MANGTKELNTSPITIEDEIDEFSEKPVQSKTLYKKLKELEDGTLPDTAAASVGDALVLDEDKNPKWAPPNALPDTTDAAAGDALVLDDDKIPVWRTPSGGDNYYLHQIRFSFSNTPSSGLVQFSIISNDSDPYTRDTFFEHLVQVGNPSLYCYGAIFNSNSLIYSCKYTPASLKVQLYVLAFSISSTDIHINDGSGPAINLGNIGLTDYVVKAKIGT